MKKTGKASKNRHRNDIAETQGVRVRENALQRCDCHYRHRLDQKNVESVFKIKQYRKKKRSLHETTARKGRKQKNTTSKRNPKNTKALKRSYLNDKVRLYGKVGYITGFTGTSGAYAKDETGEYITVPGKTYKQVNLTALERICHNNNWQFIQHAMRSA